MYRNTADLFVDLLFIYLLLFFKKMGFYHDGQAGLELLTSGDPLISASQSARITGVSHLAECCKFLPP